LLVALVVCRGMVVLSILPPFEGWDEYQHVAYVEHIRQTGQAPVVGQTTVAPALLSELVKFPHPEFAIKQPGRVGAVDYSTFWNHDGSSGQTRSLEDFRNQKVLLYQAQNSTFFYRLAAPLFAALGGIQSLRWSVAGMRLMNVGLIATAVWVSLEVLRRVVPKERDAALIGMAIAAHPLFLMNGARCSNDALGVLLATLAIASSMALASRSDDRRLASHGAITGCLIGLAIMAKATNIALIPFAATCWLIMLIRLRPKGMRASLAALALGLGILAVIQSEVRFNLSTYGSLSSMQEVLVNQRMGKTTTDLLRTASTVNWPRTISHLWDRELFFVGGWSMLPTHPRMVMLYHYLVMVGLAGWIWLGTVLIVRRRRFARG
jgi:Dolichyl-phosphate-mannose-protein mannosyltransferase